MEGCARWKGAHGGGGAPRVISPIRSLLAPHGQHKSAHLSASSLALSPASLPPPKLIERTKSAPTPGKLPSQLPSRREYRYTFFSLPVDGGAQGVGWGVGGQGAGDRRQPAVVIK